MSCVAVVMLRDTEKRIITYEWTNLNIFTVKRWRIAVSLSLRDSSWFCKIIWASWSWWSRYCCRIIDACSEGSRFITKQSPSIIFISSLGDIPTVHWLLECIVEGMTMCCWRIRSMPHSLSLSLLANSGFWRISWPPSLQTLRNRSTAAFCREGSVIFS